MPYRIIRVDGEDEEYAELLKELHDEIFSNTAPQIDPERGWWWVATDGREFAGICGFTPTYTDPTIGYLKRAGVRLPHRGNGLQRRFVRVREMLARKLCLHCLVTDTSDKPIVRKQPDRLRLPHLSAE